MPRAKLTAPGPIEMEDVKRAIATGQAGIDSGLLLNSILVNWGSIEAFGRDLYGEFAASKPGSFARQKIMDLICRLTIKVTEQQLSKPRRPEDMSDAELIDQARMLLERVGDERSTPTTEA